MTQVPYRSTCPADAPVVLDAAPAEPSANRTAPATPTPALPDKLHNALALAIYKVGIPLSAASAAAEAIGAHPKLLDAIVAHRQPSPLGYLVVRRNPEAGRYLPNGQIQPTVESAKARLDYIGAAQREAADNFLIAEVRELPEEKQ